MTWLDLIDLLRKQPLYLLEENATVGCVIVDDNGDELDYLHAPIEDAVSPINDGDLTEWLRNPDFHLSLNIELAKNDLP